MQLPTTQYKVNIRHKFSLYKYIIRLGVEMKEKNNEAIFKIEFNLRELLLIANALTRLVNYDKSSNEYQEYAKIIQKIYNTIRRVENKQIKYSTRLK